MNAQVQQLLDEVKAEKGVTQSLLTLFQGYVALVQAGIDAEDLGAIKQATDDLTGNTNVMQDAVNNNPLPGQPPVVIPPVG
jgi:hypothetical protein